jgi:predicted phage tail component-like protein
MIVFDGVSLKSVANVRVEDIRVSPIQLSPVARQRPIQYGAEFVRMSGGERQITISFAILESNPIIRQEAFLNLAKWAKTDAEHRMELPMEPNKYLQCVRTAMPEPSTRAWWENKLKLVFTCFDNPFWTAKAEKSAACGSQFVVLGDAPPLMQIRRTLSSAASNQSYSNGAQTMTFTTVPTGDMIIDLNKQTAAVGVNSIMQYYQPSGAFIIPKTGAQTITGTGTVYYRERWE